MDGYTGKNSTLDKPFLFESSDFSRILDQGQGLGKRNYWQNPWITQSMKIRLTQAPSPYFLSIHCKITGCKTSQK